MRIKVQACGICHSDAMTKEGLWPGITFPRPRGTRVIGVIDAVELYRPGTFFTDGKTLVWEYPSKSPEAISWTSSSPWISTTA